MTTDSASRPDSTAGRSLEGRRVVVTGGARGMAAAGVRAFVREGAAVVVLDVLDDLGAQVVAEATAAGSGTASYLHCDISDRNAVEAAFAAAAERLGGLDGLVHAAAIERAAPAEEITDAEWQRVLDVNLTGTFLTNQAAFPYLKANGGGRIVNYASGAALYPYQRGAHYSASKAGVISWTRTIAHEWGKYGIAAVAVNPSIWTPMYQEFRDRLSPDELVEHDRKKAEQIPLGGRLGDPDRDMAPVLVFLLGDGARFITGQIISVDGGMVPLR
jgi:NAD(P)-dependent dehydrogenase (short-subunit alcohol dehydrogenase family)